MNKQQALTTAVCSQCHKQQTVLHISLERAIKKRGSYICRSCVAKLTPKPQCSVAYWTLERRKSHGEKLKTNEKYQSAIKNRKSVVGADNPMFGKKHSVVSVEKMSRSRTGKTGPQSTAWKGGKLSLTRRVKGILHTRFGWYKRVYQRDWYKCVRCGSAKQIDAHHIEPVWKLIRSLLKDNNKFATEEEKLEWLVSQDCLKDPDLKNGMTLCRLCHQQEHQNWGSHYVR